MQNFYINLTHAGYGTLSLILFLYINLIYELVEGFCFKKKNITANYSLAFLYTILFGYIQSLFGKFGSLITLICIFIYLIYLCKEKRYLIKISDIGFVIFLGLLFGLFFHSATNKISSGINPGDIYTYANWFSSLLEYPNEFKELSIFDLKFANLIQISGNGILIIASSIFRFIDINPINFVCITLPITGLVLIKKSSIKIFDLQNSSTFFYLFNRSGIINYLIIFGLLPYPLFIVESPSTLIGLAFLINCSEYLYKNKLSSLRDFISYLINIYSFYCSKLAVSPSIFLRYLIKNTKYFYTSLLTLLIVLILVVSANPDLFSILIKPSFTLANFLKIILLLSYLFFLSFNSLDLIIILICSVIFIFSYTLFSSIISGCALSMFCLKQNDTSKFKNSLLLKILLVSLTFISIYLSQPNIKFFGVNLVIISSSIIYLSYKEDLLFSNYFLKLKRYLPKYNISFSFVALTSFLIIFSILLKPYECEKSYCSFKSFDKYEYKTYRKIRDLTKNSSLIFIDNFDGIDLSSLSRRQFYISGWQNTKLRNNKNKISELIKINNKITNLDEKSCKFARDISKNDLYIIRKTKKDKIKIVNSNHKRIYSNKKYEIFKSC